MYRDWIKLAYTLLLLTVYPLYGKEDPLPSWNQTETKQIILDFVYTVSDVQDSNYIPLQDRIAVIDNDGTLWNEKPQVTQLAFLIDSLKGYNPLQIEKILKQPLNLLNRLFKKSDFSRSQLAELTSLLFSGLTIEDYQQKAAMFLYHSLHPRFEIPYTQTVYQPMLELIEFLHSKDFKVYIVSGGGTNFIRSYSEDIYGISRERVIGTMVATDLDDNELKLLPAIIPPVTKREGKVIQIQRHIDRVPILAIGNSDGDIEMLQYVKKDGPSLSLLIHHDDEEREYQYDEGAKDVLKMAVKKNWTIVSMKEDFKIVFPSY